MMKAFDIRMIEHKNKYMSDVWRSDKVKERKWKAIKYRMRVRDRDRVCKHRH